jgi:hypothetical protein
MNNKKAALRLEELAEDIYDKLEKIREVLMDTNERVYEQADAYWLAHIDGALLNKGGYLGGSMVSLKDTLLRLEEEE